MSVGGQGPEPVDQQIIGLDAEHAPREQQEIVDDPGPRQQRGPPPSEPIGRRTRGPRWSSMVPPNQAPAGRQGAGAVGRGEALEGRVEPGESAEIPGNSRPAASSWRGPRGRSAAPRCRRRSGEAGENFSEALGGLVEGPPGLGGADEAVSPAASATVEPLAQRAGVEVAGAPRRGGRPQPAVEPIGPAMVGAEQPPRAPRSSCSRQAPRCWQTLWKPSQRQVRAPGQQDARRGERGQHKTPRARGALALDLHRPTTAPRAARARRPARARPDRPAEAGAGRWPGGPG